MLEVDNGKKLMDELWEAAPTKVVLSDAIKARFLALRGPMPIYHENNRAYHRYYLRGKAVLKRNSNSGE